MSQGMPKTLFLTKEIPFLTLLCLASVSRLRRTAMVEDWEWERNQAREICRFRNVPLAWKFVESNFLGLARVSKLPKTRRQVPATMIQKRHVGTHNFLETYRGFAKEAAIRNNFPLFGIRRRGGAGQFMEEYTISADVWRFLADFRRLGLGYLQF